MDRLRDFGFLLKEVSRLYSLRFERSAAEMSLTLPLCKVLAYLERNEGIHQSRLAELTSIEPMTMVRLINRMEEDGLVERRADPADRRVCSLYLTAKATPTVKKIWRLGDEVRSEIFRGIRKAEREAFLDVLDRLRQNLRQSEVLAALSVADAKATRKPKQSSKRKRTSRKSANR